LDIIISAKLMVIEYLCFITGRFVLKIKLIIYCR